MSRKLDEKVAELVMGWKRYGAIRYGKPTVVLVSRERDCWTYYSRTQSDPGSWEETRDEIVHFGGPKFTTDPAADYEVLKHVRETWTRFEKSVFHASLEDMWFVRGFDEFPAEAYQPGDYAIAALAVKEAT